METQYQNKLGNDTMFDVLMNTGRWRKNDIRYALPMIRISQDILAITILCFHQSTIISHRKNVTKSRFLIALYDAVSYIFRSKSSPGIGKDIGIQLQNAEALQYTTEFIGSTSEELETLWLLCLPFQEREYRLVETLKSWKPKSIWDLRFPGYGSVDPINLYAFYFAGFIGVVAIFSFALSIVQTYATFKSVPSG